MARHNSAGRGPTAPRRKESNPSMKQILIVTERPDRFAAFTAGLEEGGCAPRFVSDRHELRDLLTRSTPELVVVDDRVGGMTGIQVVREVVVMTNPLANTALVHAMDPDAFHEAAEGLGILAELPPNPEKEDARRLLSASAEVSQ